MNDKELVIQIGDELRLQIGVIVKEIMKKYPRVEAVTYPYFNILLHKKSDTNA